MSGTSWHLQKRSVYRNLSILSSMALLLRGVLLVPPPGHMGREAACVAWPSQVMTPVAPQPINEGWDEGLAPWRSKRGPRRYRQICLAFLGQRAKVLLARLGLVAALLLWSGWPQRQGWRWCLLAVPLADALLPLLALVWPRLTKRHSYLYLVRTRHQVYVIVLVLSFSQGLMAQGQQATSLGLVSGYVEMADGAQARGWIADDGTWNLEREGRVTFSHKPRNEFEKRAMLFFFRQFRAPQSTAKRPFLRQEWLAEWFDTYQELISRWQRYVREGGLQKLSGEYDGWVLTQSMREAIHAIWVPNFWLSAAQVRQRLLAAGHITSLNDISEKSIHQAARDSGFAEVRRLLRQMLRFTADGPQWRDGVLIGRSFELHEALMAGLEAEQGLTPQRTLEAASLKQALGAPVRPLKKPLPWAYRLQQALFGQWQDIEDGSVQCPHCGSSLVAGKGNKPRRKKYRDPQTGEWQETEGYRYYCYNPACPFGTFTDYPDGVRLYSCWTVETVIWGVMVYVQMRTTYRRAAEAVGVSHVTLWRWAMLIGQQSLPIATLFGVVRCSGVVGIDEKWVLVPKNDEPAGQRKRWMYVYLAVDVYTYDVPTVLALHIDIYPYDGKDEARAFLQALEAQGYQPHVIITDMNQDYSEPIPQVFPHAEHHECVFHALQWAQRLIKDVYGHDYADKYPKAQDLKQRIYELFDAKTKRTVDKRYRQVMALEEQYVAEMDEAKRIFDFLKRHYPKLVNAVENPLIPSTNNTVELVIRRFDQHYQNMCGFDSIETAWAYLNLFELVYRFTPFVQDNRPVKGRELDIRGKCPLELAGYDISHMPIAQIMRARILGLPPKAIQQHLVPNP